MKKLIIGIVAIAFLAGAYWFSNSQSATAAKDSIDPAKQKQIESALRFQMDIPEQIGVKIGKRTPSKVNGVVSLAVDFVIPNSPTPQSRSFFMGKKLRYLFFPARSGVELIDVTRDPKKELLSKIKLDDPNAKGPKNAKVTLVEYSDFQCPFCKKLTDDGMKQVMSTYGDKVRVIFKHFPLNFHKWAEPAAVAAECAGKQKSKSFWAFHDFYFDQQKAVTEQNVKERSMELAKRQGLKLDVFETCYDKQETLAKVKADMAEGQAVKVKGVPYVVIIGKNVKTLSGAQPFTAFKAAIDQELAR